MSRGQRIGVWAVLVAVLAVGVTGWALTFEIDPGSAWRDALWPYADYMGWISLALILVGGVGILYLSIRALLVDLIWQGGSELIRSAYFSRLWSWRVRTDGREATATAKKFANAYASTERLLTRAAALFEERNLEFWFADWSLAASTESMKRARTRREVDKVFKGIERSLFRSARRLERVARSLRVVLREHSNDLLRYLQWTTASDAAECKASMTSFVATLERQEEGAKDILRALSELVAEHSRMAVAAGAFGIASSAVDEAIDELKRVTTKGISTVEAR